MNKILSVFIDESGDFGSFRQHSPYYLVTMILHDQNVNITENIKSLENHLHNLNFEYEAVHTGPVIRREEVYRNMLMEGRKRIFNALFNFFISLSCEKQYFSRKVAQEKNWQYK